MGQKELRLPKNAGELQNIFICIILDGQNVRTVLSSTEFLNKAKKQKGKKKSILQLNNIHMSTAKCT